MRAQLGCRAARARRELLGRVRGGPAGVRVRGGPAGVRARWARRDARAVRLRMASRRAGSFQVVRMPSGLFSSIFRVDSPKFAGNEPARRDAIQEMLAMSPLATLMIGRRTLPIRSHPTCRIQCASSWLFASKLSGSDARRVRLVLFRCAFRPARPLAMRVLPGLLACDARCAPLARIWPACFRRTPRPARTHLGGPLPTYTAFSRLHLGVPLPAHAASRLPASDPPASDLRRI